MMNIVIIHSLFFKYFGSREVEKKVFVLFKTRYSQQGVGVMIFTLYVHLALSLLDTYSGQNNRVVSERKLIISGC